MEAQTKEVTYICRGQYGTHACTREFRGSPFTANSAHMRLTWYMYMYMYKNAHNQAVQVRKYVTLHFATVCASISILIHLPCVSTGQPLSGAGVSVYLELLYTVHSFEGGKALERYLGRPRHKLDKTGTIGLVKGAQGSPKPLDLRWSVLYIIICT